jgi:hypothetical protein
MIFSYLVDAAPRVRTLVPRASSKFNLHAGGNLVSSAPGTLFPWESVEFLDLRIALRGHYRPLSRPTTSQGGAIEN